MWFVIHVKPGTEPQVVNILKSTDRSDGLDEVFCPLVECMHTDHGTVRETYKPMMDGYVFALAPSKWELRACMQKAPELEAFYSQKPSYEQLEDGEETFINQWTAPTERVCAQSDALVGEDGLMTITAGPLKGRENEVAKYSSGRRWAYLDTRIAGEPVRAHIGLRLTRKDRKQLMTTAKH